MPALIEITAQPNNTYKVALSFTDEEGDQVTPNAPLTWSLTDEAGTVINSRSGVSITPAPSIEIFLSDADLASLGADDTGLRKFSLVGDYDSSGETGLTLDQTLIFPIDVLPVSLALIKKHCNLDPDFEDDDALLQVFARAVLDHGQNTTGRKFIQSQSILELDAFPSGIWKSSKIDLAASLQSVTSITYVDANGDTQTMDPADYEVKTSPLVGFVRPVYDDTWPSDAVRDIVITYQSGWPTGAIPKPVHVWMLVRIASFYEQRETFITGTIFSKMPENFVDHLLDAYKIPVVA